MNSKQTNGHEQSGTSLRLPVIDQATGRDAFFNRATLARLSTLEGRLQNLRISRSNQRPQLVRRAIRELDELVLAAGRVLRRLAGADRVFRRIVQGPAPSHSSRAVADMDIPPFGTGCADRMGGAIEVLQAGFSIDFAERDRDAIWTTRTAAYVKQRMQIVTDYTASMEGQILNHGDPTPPPNRPPNGGLAPPAPGPGRGRVPDLCDQIADLCISVFQETSVATLGDPLIDLIGSVEPNCLCHDYDPDQIFTARPRANAQFPVPLPNDANLFFRGEIITPRIVAATAQQIQFRIPPQSQTGYVYLRRMVQPRRPGVDLSRLCGNVVPSVPEIPFAGASPRALLSIVYPPAIDRITVDGLPGLVVQSEACHAAEICWHSHVSDQTPQLPLPPGASIEVTVTESDSNVIVGGPAGCFAANEQQEKLYRFQARSFALGASCGVSEEVVLRVERVKKLTLELEEPSSGEIARGNHGRLTLSASCPASAGGIEIQLTTTPANVLDLPVTVRLETGQTDLIIDFAARSDAARGPVTVSAATAGHESAQVTFAIVVPTAFALSGGGAMGSFEAGALLYFGIERWAEVDPDIVCGSSVGSINALPIAEGTGLEGIRRLERVWLSLRRNEDMYVDTPDFADIKRIVADLRGLRVDDFVRPEAVVTGIALGGLTGGVLGLLVGAGLEAEDLADRVQELVPLVTRMRYLYSLSPTRSRVLSTFHFQQIENSGKRLRLATVCLEDGETYYMTEHGQLIRGHAGNPSIGNLDGTIDERLTNGAMASSGIPAIFPFFSFRVMTNNGDQYLTMVDGGVREALPVRAAAELQARLIIAISATPNLVAPFQSPFNNQVITQFRNENWLSFAMRSVNLAVHEVARNEIAPDQPYCDDIDRVLIIPTIPVHPPTEIHPGLILINMAYGYQRAFDAYAIYRQNPPDDVRQNLIDSSNLITMLRRQIWDLEEAVGKVIDPTRGILDISTLTAAELALYPAPRFWFDPSILTHIRQLKATLMDRIIARFAFFGAESLPKEFSDPNTGYVNTIFDWFETWERHREPLDTFLRGFGLFSPLPIRVEVVVRNEIGSLTQIFETSAPPRPVLPDGIRNALQP